MIQLESIQSNRTYAYFRILARILTEFSIIVLYNKGI